MRKILVTLAVVAGLSACTAASGEPTTAKDTASTAPSATPSASVEPTEPSVTPTPTPTPTPSPALVADPAGTFSESCDYILGDFSSNTPTGYRFVADAHLKNTGNVGIMIEVTATWFQAGGKAVVKTKNVPLDPGKSQRVGFTYLASSDQIDLIQALDYDQQCRVNVKIIDTVGDPV